MGTEESRVGKLLRWAVAFGLLIAFAGPAMAGHSGHRTRHKGGHSQTVKKGATASPSAARPAR